MLCVTHGRAWGFLGEWFQQLLGVNLGLQGVYVTRLLHGVKAGC